MDLSIFLARFLGIYLLIVALIWALRKDQFIATFKDITSSNSFMMIFGILNLMLGLAIAIAHPFFESSWVGLITLIGYLAIISGIIRIAFPNELRKFSDKILQVPGYWIAFGIYLVLGLILTYAGFAAGNLWA